MLQTIERVTGQRITVEKVPTVADLRARRLELTPAGLEDHLLDDDLERFRAGRSPASPTSAGRTSRVRRPCGCGWVARGLRPAMVHGFDELRGPGHGEVDAERAEVDGERFGGR